MSALPLPSKSPVPATDQTVGALPTPDDCAIAAPFISHIATLPLPSRKRMSAEPSPSKSRWPTIAQVPPATPTPADGDTAAPFISHIAMLPLVLLQSISLL